MSNRASLCLLLSGLLVSSCERSHSGPVSDSPASPGPAGLGPTIRITVDPHSTRRIGGESELDRKRYFAISDSGTKFDSRVLEQERYEYLVGKLGIQFGRSLGLVNWLSKDERLVREDPSRPGFTDLTQLQQRLKSRWHKSSERMRSDFGPNLDVALHGQHGAYPEFMGTYLSDWMRKQEGSDKPHKDHLPENVEAAAELAATVLKDGYDDFTRPRFYEPVNEPHWSYMTDPEHLANWHLAMMKRVHTDVPGVLVGGPCNSVGHLYSKGYHSFRSVRNFMDATGGKMDFYSFHVYDYYRWQGEDFDGSILSGLPLEGVLDLVPNYSTLSFGKETSIVVSEHGGYAPQDGGDDENAALEKIAAARFPGSGFEWEMKARSIHDFIQSNSTIANTLTFMDHPHIVKKAVPFILLETSGWDPRYYATLYAKKNFDKKSKEWIPTTLHHFYQLFRDVNGRRVVARCPDPDIQVRAFVDGSQLFVIAHNLAEKPETLGLEAPAPNGVTLRRYGRNEDLTPFLREENETTLSSIPLGARETVMVIADYDHPLEPKRTLDEVAHYGQAVTVPVEEKGEAEFRIALPDPTGIDHATLRIGYNRPAGSGRNLRVILNGSELTVPIEDSAARLDHAQHGYSTTKLVPVSPKLLQAKNNIVVSFPDGGKGTIGSVVIRVAQ